MAKPELLLSLEGALNDKLEGKWDKVARRLATRLVKALEEDDLAKVDKLINEARTANLHKGEHKYIRYIGLSSMLFGASLVSGTAKKSSIAKAKKPPQILVPAVKQMKVMLEEGDKTLRKELGRMVQKAIEVRDSNQVQKAAKVRTMEEIVKMGTGRVGKGIINIAASLHTSRLSAYGFCVEAQVTGITRYGINEQLDNRICPVCREMHGKTFEVQQAYTRLDSLLRVENTEDLKQLAPWPKQDKNSLERFKRMNESDLVSAGWSIPPFHPGCRGLLSKTMDVPALPAAAADVPVSTDIAGVDLGTPTGIVSSGVIDLAVEGATKTFSMPKRAITSGDKLVLVDTLELDKIWKKDKDYYIGVGGEGGISGRYARFEKYLDEHDDILVSELGINEYGMSFTNGRHRAAVLRDKGMIYLPVAMDDESIQWAKSLKLIED